MLGPVRGAAGSVGRSSACCYKRPGGDQQPDRWHVHMRFLGVPSRTQTRPEVTPEGQNVVVRLPKNGKFDNKNAKGERDSRLNFALVFDLFSQEGCCFSTI